MRAVHRLALIAALLVCALASAASFQPPPAPNLWVTDTAGALSPTVRQTLNDRLRGYERATGHQVIVWIGDSTGDVPLEQWAADTFKAWGIGRKQLDDGLAVFLFMQDRRIRIEVGYGLEPTVPDAIASRVIRDDAIPHLKQGDPDGAVLQTVDALLARIGGEPPSNRITPGYQHAQASQTSTASDGGGAPLLCFIVVIILVIAMRRPRRYGGWGGWGGPWGGGFGGGGWGGGGGGGGGFSGGGGSSGGGGASGSW